MVAVHARPLIASATHAVRLTCAKGMGALPFGIHGFTATGNRIHAASITVPDRIV